MKTGLPKYLYIFQRIKYDILDKRRRLKKALNRFFRIFSPGLKMQLFYRFNISGF